MTFCSKYGWTSGPSSPKGTRRPGMSCSGAQHSATQRSAARHGAARRGTARHGTTGHGTAMSFSAAWQRDGRPREGDRDRRRDCGDSSFSQGRAACRPSDRRPPAAVFPLCWAHWQACADLADASAHTGLHRAQAAVGEQRRPCHGVGHAPTHPPTHPPMRSCAHLAKDGGRAHVSRPGCEVRCRCAAAAAAILQVTEQGPATRPVHVRAAISGTALHRTRRKAFDPSSRPFRLKLFN